MTVKQLIYILQRSMLPIDEYTVLLCTDSYYPGTNWTDTFFVEVDHVRNVVRIKGEVT